MADRGANTRQHDNAMAPGLPLELSSAAQARVAELRASGEASPYATPNTAAIRRLPRPLDDATPSRPAFVRDAEKIMHLPAYNRLAGKTQVFSFRADDDITRRGLHVQLVDRIARDIALCLGLNVDLVDAIALGHDIGHTPFGHVGERCLNDVYNAHTGRFFFHNVQSVRVLDVLYGRNLALQTLDGVICHNGEFEQQVFETSGLDGFSRFDEVVESCWATGDLAIGRLRPMTLEGCVVRLADIIAYVGKDRQDAIHAGILGEGDFADGLGGAYNAWALSAFATDVVEHSLDKPRIEMSEAAFRELGRAKHENYEKIYLTGEADGDSGHAVGELFGRLYERLLADLAEGDEGSPIFLHHIEPLSRFLSHYGRRYEWERDLDLTVVDYLSSMTDDYFMAICERYFPESCALFPRSTYFDGVDGYSWFEE